MKRQPIVVSKISAERENASGALPITNGARVIDSTPPAIAKSISPARIARPAAPTASSPEAQRRLSVRPGIESGRPAHNSARRRPVEVGMARHQRLDRGRGEVVGADLGQGAAKAADRGPDGIAHEYISH